MPTQAILETEEAAADVNVLSLASIVKVDDKSSVVSFVPQSLVGATIRIKTGQYAGHEGVITEQKYIPNGKKLHGRVQLDTMIDTIRLEDIRIIEYADNGICIDDVSKFSVDLRYLKCINKYMGAKVRVAENAIEYAGTVGRVTNVLYLGYWFITDNPKIDRAFPRDEFDIIKHTPETPNAVSDIDDDSFHICVSFSTSGSIPTAVFRDAKHLSFTDPPPACVLMLWKDVVASLEKEVGKWSQLVSACVASPRLWSIPHFFPL